LLLPVRVDGFGMLLAERTAVLWSLLFWLAESWVNSLGASASWLLLLPSSPLAAPLAGLALLSWMAASNGVPALPSSVADLVPFLPLLTLAVPVDAAAEPRGSGVASCAAGLALLRRPAGAAAVGAAISSGLALLHDVPRVLRKPNALVCPIVGAVAAQGAEGRGKSNHRPVAHPCGTSCCPPAAAVAADASMPPAWSNSALSRRTDNLA
jgi:hypothetical protein